LRHPRQQSLVLDNICQHILLRFLTLLDLRILITTASYVPFEVAHCVDQDWSHKG